LIPGAALALSTLAGCAVGPDLFQALGGGWWNRADVLPNPLSPEGHFIDAIARATTTGNRK
jgi:hypothetical protein